MSYPVQHVQFDPENSVIASRILAHLCPANTHTKRTDSVISRPLFNPPRLLAVLIKDCSIAKSVHSAAQNRSDLLIV